MNERIDVLAVMDSCTDELEKQPGCYYTDAAELQKARAAVAELIGYMKQIRIEATESPQTDADRLTAIEAMASAAIARVGGAA